MTVEVNRVNGHILEVEVTVLANEFDKGNKRKEGLKGNS